MFILLLPDELLSGIVVCWLDLNELRSKEITISINDIVLFNRGLPDISMWILNVNDTLYILTFKHLSEHFIERIIRSVWHIEVLKIKSCR
jgi:hypothetical protein